MRSFSYFVECSSSCYLRMSDRTKDASGHAQMLLFKPGFLSFQKTPLQIDKNLLSVFFLCDFSTVLTLSNTIIQWIFIEYLWSRTWHQGWLNVVAYCCYLFIIIISIIIAIIFKNENPMVCLLALWVYKCFFSLKTSSYTLYKRWIFPYFLCH